MRNDPTRTAVCVVPTDSAFEDQREAWVEAITRPHSFVSHGLYDEITKPAERALGEMLDEIRRLRAALTSPEART